MPAGDRANRQPVYGTPLTSSGVDRRNQLSGAELPRPADVADAAADSKRISHGNEISFGFLNAGSVGNKFTTICNEISSRNLDICLLNETWHSSNNDTALRRCVPVGFSLRRSAQVWQRRSEPWRRGCHCVEQTKVPGHKATTRTVNIRIDVFYDQWLSIFNCCGSQYLQTRFVSSY